MKPFSGALPVRAIGQTQVEAWKIKRGAAVSPRSFNYERGIGIPPDVLPRIFNAFEQGDAHITRQFGGLGLGLAISRALVELHGGTFRAESEGQVTLPRWSRKK